MRTPGSTIKPYADMVSVDGHSWLVKWLFDVDVYRKDHHLKLM